MKTVQKVLIVAILLLSNFIPLQSQSVLTEGAEWYYNFTKFWTSGIGFNYCSISGDTIIDQKECMIFERFRASCDMRPIQDYIYEEDDKVYYYESVKERFVMLYDFSLNIGDTLALEYWPNFSLYEDSLFYLRVDSIDMFELDTFQLKRFYVTYDAWDENEISFANYGGIIIEGIGSINNFFHFTENGICDWQYTWGLRCFTYPGLDDYNFGNVACDFMTNTSEITEPKEINIYPNPFNNTLTLQTDFEIDHPDIVIYDLLGREILRKTSDTNGPLDETIELSFLPESVYLVNIFERKRSGARELVYMEKVVKN